MGEIKGREAYYCNIKLLLLYLVILGHWMEPFLERSFWAALAYHIIYTVHMPLFVFLSGAFLTSCRQARLQASRALTCYLVLQAPIALGGILLGEPMLLLTPWWHLWYLLSLCQWALICLGLERLCLPARPGWVKAAVLLLAVGAGCAAGIFPWIGRGLSLSRTLVFLPYVLAGRLCPQGLFQGRRWLGWAALAGFCALYLLCGSAIPTEFLYQAEGFGALSPLRGIALRLACYGLGALLGIALLALMPERRLPVSRMGGDTLGIYLCHAPLVLLLRLLPAGPEVMLLAAPAGSAWVLWLLYRVFRWRGQWYAVGLAREGGG